MHIYRLYELLFSYESGPTVKEAIGTVFGVNFRKNGEKSWPHHGPPLKIYAKIVTV